MFCPILFPPMSEASSDEARERETHEVLTSRCPVTDNFSLGRPVSLPASEFPEERSTRKNKGINKDHTSARS